VSILHIAHDVAADYSFVDAMNRDLRFPVATVVTDGMTVEEILAEHPDLEAEDLTQSLHYAAFA